MKAPALVDPALNLHRALDAGALFTPLAEDMCGQAITADIERLNPPYLFPDEIGYLGIDRDSEPLAALRRAGDLVQSDGTKVAKISSVVAVSRTDAIDPGICRKLTTTNIPLGKALGDRAHSKVLWSSPGIDKYAVHCCRLIMVGGVAVALTVDRVLWSWLAGVSPT